jgi:hypothetical protein
MLTAGKLQDVVETGAPFTWAEAVAIVQQVIASSERDRAGAPSAPGLENLWLAPDGAVFCDNGMPPALTVGDAATLLDALLRHAGGTSLPGSLQYTLARAKHQVDAPPYESIAALAKALSRQERAGRTAILRDLYSRTMNPAPRTAETPQAPRAVSMPSRTAVSERTPTPIDLAGRAADGGPHFTRRPAAVERRRNGLAVDELRRELRAADAECYRAHVRPADDNTRLPGMSELDPMLTRTEADTLRSFSTPRDSRFPRQPLVWWIVAGMAAVMIAFGAGYGFTYEWRHRETQPHRVQLLKVGSPAPDGFRTADAPAVTDEPVSPTADRRVQ